LSLGEGDTPFLPIHWIVKALGMSALFMKDEGLNPSGSFKARGLSVAVARAAGWRVPKPCADRLILRALRDCRGGGLRVTEEAIRRAECDLAVQEDILVYPEGAVALAGLRELVAQSAVVPEERILLFKFGTGKKYLQ